MDEAKEYLTTERMGAYYPEKAVVKKSENGVTRALYRDSCYTIDDVNYTRERIMIIKGKRFIVRPDNECVIVESTHPALVTKEQWDIVQDLRKQKKTCLKAYGRAEHLFRNHFLRRLRKVDGIAPSKHNEEI